MKVAKKTPTRPAQTKALKISAMTRYALRILMDIASHEKDGVPRTEKMIAERQGISMKFLSRIVIPLRRARLIASHKGANAGFTLLKKPEEITLLQIVEIMQGPVAVLDCLDRRVRCGRSRACAARRIWCRVNTALSDALESITLADAIKK